MERGRVAEPTGVPEGLIILHTYWWNNGSHGCHEAFGALVVSAMGIRTPAFSSCALCSSSLPVTADFEPLPKPDLEALLLLLQTHRAAAPLRRARSPSTADHCEREDVEVPPSWSSAQRC